MGSQYSRIGIVTLYKLITFCVWEIHFIFTLIPLHYAALHAKTSPSCEDGIIEWKTVSEQTSEKKTDLQKNSLPVPDLNFVIPTKVPVAFCELNTVHVTPSLVFFFFSKGFDWIYWIYPPLAVVTVSGKYSWCQCFSVSYRAARTSEEQLPNVLVTTCERKLLFSSL